VDDHDEYSSNSVPRGFIYRSNEPVESFLRHWVLYGYTEWSWTNVAYDANIVFKAADRARIKMTVIKLDRHL
jgi:hypothetical protein